MQKKSVADLLLFLNGSMGKAADTLSLKIYDIDFYAKQCYMNETGQSISDPDLMSPEENRVAGLVDEISNVYTMGAMAFVFCRRTTV